VEFPGGKVETGETLEQALVRELREELAINAQIGPEVFRMKHAHEELREPLELIFLLASAPSDQIQNRVFEKIVWRTPESLPELDFLPADRELITKLANGTVPLDGWI
jgi:mutator protein MutT